MGVRHVHLIRHGQYSHDPELLTDLGRSQAHMVGVRLGGLGVRALTCSTMPRAKETAGLVAGPLSGVRPRATDLLREHVPSPPRHGEPPTWFAELAEPVRQKWRDQLEAASARIMKPTRADERHDVIVAHGNTIRALICRALELGPGVWWDLQVPAHCSVSTVLVRRTSCALERFNDVGHLPPAMRTDV